MVTLLQTTFPLNENYCVLIQISLKFVGKDPDGNKPLPDPILTYHQWVLWHVFEGMSQKVLKNSICNMNWQITHLKLLP